jgi:hypothetical protein
MINAPLFFDLNFFIFMNNRHLAVNKPDILQVQANKKFNLNVNIKRYTTDANGTVLDDALVPLAMQKAFPFHMFGEYDKNGGYAIADRILSQVNNTILFGVYTWGLNTPLFPFNALATINNYFKKGDIIFVYVDDINAPTIFSFVIVSTEQGAYGSLISQLNTTQLDRNRWGAFKIFNVEYTCLNESQFEQSIFMVETKFDGSMRSDTLQPLAYYHPQYKTGINKIIIPMDAIANQFFGFSTLLSFSNPLLNLSFTVYA